MTGVNSGVVRTMFFPALTFVFLRLGKVPVIRTSVVVTNAGVVAAKTKVTTMKTNLFVEPALVCVTKTEVPVTVALVNVTTSLVCRKELPLSKAYSNTSYVFSMACSDTRF